MRHCMYTLCVYPISDVVTYAHKIESFLRILFLLTSHVVSEIRFHLRFS